ncbi:autophagy-related protein 13-domain-containing protein [Gilbertella persicaria]|uniref:autophagy-related protein 13-domain-containing protein n=1 Tax=Gilbertella persicaria TaxID=101096 RepID=UPI00221F05F1|nr:autophagy-related protein 13-domain-containing protein [Gilbertella persicaria]KAI8075403.1 autophagy-related protein 13-domain-containing protein [Gilbertella persicaria]
MQSSNNPSSAIPTGPSTSTNIRNSKLDQIIQNFYTKTVQIVIQGRCHDTRYGKRASLKGSSSSRKINKWFNIATDDVEVLKEELKYWRTIAIQSDKEPPPMILDIYLDTSKLSFNQSLIVADDNLRWGRIELNKADTHIDKILIESWELSLKHPLPDFSVDLPNLYKRSIVFFRSLHSLTRILPSYDLYRQIRKSSDTALSIGYRLSSSASTVYPEEISLGSTILENDARKPTKTYEFSDIVTPIGTFKLNVTYRRNCDFRVEDTERDLSAQFIDMDEQFFTPTMAKYQQHQHRHHQQQQQQHQHQQIPAQEQLMPMFSSKQSSLDTKADLTPSVSTSSRENRPPSLRQIGRSESPTGRRASAPFVVSPFKSPFLSSSPQADSIFGSSGAQLATQRQYAASPTPSERSARPLDSGSFSRKIEFSSSFDKYKSSSPSRESPSSASMMMRRWSRTSDLSSIYFKAEDDDNLEDFVRLVGSNQELKLFQQRGNSDLLSSASDSETSSMMKLSHFQNLRETHNSLSESLSSSMLIQQQPHHQDTTGAAVNTISPVSSTSSTGRSYQPVVPSPLHAEQRSTSPVHIPRSYPQLRSNMMMTNALKIGHRSSHSHDQEQRDDDGEGGSGEKDLSAYSTYPQDYHRQELHLIRHDIGHTISRITTTPGTTATTTTMTAHHDNNHPTNMVANTASTERHAIAQPRPRSVGRGSTIRPLSSITRGEGESSSDLYNRSGGSSLLMQDHSTDNHSSHRASVMDDDDSLVFKMSELECEGPPRASTTPPNKQHEMVFNNRHKMFIKSASTSTSPTNYDQFLEVTPTPLSPPLLQRLQTMSTHTEEQEKETTAVIPKPTMPFDAW